MSAAPPPVRPSISWRRRILAVFTERLLLKAAAVFLAVVLWFVINAKEPTRELVRVRFVPVLDSSLVIRDTIEDIQATVVGSTEDLVKLLSHPPIIRRQITSETPDTLVIDLRPQDVTLPAEVDGEVEVRDVYPSSITLRFEPTWTRSVPVRSAVAVQYEAGQAAPYVRLDPAVVQITGPRLSVLRLPFVSTVHTMITAPDSLPHLVDIDTAALHGVRVRPTQIKVQIEVPGDSVPRVP